MKTIERKPYMWLVRLVFAYAPAINLLLLALLIFDAEALARNYALILFYAAALPLVYKLAESMRMCSWYKVALFTPMALIALTFVCPASMEAYLRLLGIIGTAIIEVELMLRYLVILAQRAEENPDEIYYCRAKLCPFLNH